MKKVAILYGGPDRESEVSVRSARNVLSVVDRNRFEVFEFFIDKSLNFNLVQNGKDVSAKSNFSMSESDFVKYILENKIEKVFLVLHGVYGEGGKLQKLLEENNISFVGSNSISSSNAIDKNKANNIYKENGILFPKSKIIHKDNLDMSLLDFNFKYPIIVKPLCEGSSFGLFKFSNEDEYINSLNKIFESYDEMLVQEFVVGREFTCAVVEYEKQVISLMPTEVILTKTDIFNFTAKYESGACIEATPAEVDLSTLNKIQETALMCHKVLGCKDLSRTDMVLSEDGWLYVLETNTIPGMTTNSFLPAQLKASGIEFGDFVNYMIEK